jgi:hypothetical protein
MLLIYLPNVNFLSKMQILYASAAYSSHVCGPCLIYRSASVDYRIYTITIRSNDKVAIRFSCPFHCQTASVHSCICGSCLIWVVLLLSALRTESSSVPRLLHTPVLADEGAGEQIARQADDFFLDPAAWFMCSSATRQRREDAKQRGNAAAVLRTSGRAQWRVAAARKSNHFAEQSTVASGVRKLNLADVG